MPQRRTGRAGLTINRLAVGAAGHHARDHARSAISPHGQEPEPQAEEEEQKATPHLQHAKQDKPVAEEGPSEQSDAPTKKEQDATQSENERHEALDGQALACPVDTGTAVELSAGPRAACEVIVAK